MMKKLLCIFLAAAALLSLTACGAKQDSGIAISGESVTIDDLALRPEGEVGKLYENDGMKLMVPLEYDALVEIGLPEANPAGLLFNVSEIASMEAAKKQGYDGDGAGWLFGIFRMDADAVQQMLCYSDMSGAEVFAHDEAGNYYVLRHPTDVRYVREDNEAMARDQEIWTALTEWAGSKVCESFVAENPGLTAEEHSYTSLDLALARIAYMPGASYAVSTTEFGPLSPEPGVFDAAPYLEKLMRGARYEIADGEEAPDGEYVVLSLPEENVRFDFFRMEGKKNLIREVSMDKYETLYRASFDDGVTLAADVMQDWYDALAADRDMQFLGYDADAFLGVWAEKIAGRGTIEISRAEEDGAYDVFVHWGSSAFETYVWHMTARPAASNVLRYEDCRHSILTFAEDGAETETLQYENGCGEFSLTSTNELLWQDETGHAADDTPFISAG